jgi:hypothetical protein
MSHEPQIYMIVLFATTTIRVPRIMRVKWTATATFNLPNQSARIGCELNLHSAAPIYCGSMWSKLPASAASLINSPPAQA